MKKTNKIWNNLGLKIMAVIFSILLWLVAVNINDPVERKVFRDVRVETRNTNLLTDENKLYKVLDDTDTVTVTVRASRSVLENINVSDITATADFSELSFTNTVPIRLSVNKYIDKQIEDISGSVDSMKLEVEDKKEKQFVIEIVQTGEPADGFIVGKVTTTDGNAMKISGPESVVEKVKKAVVEADVSDLTDSINITEKIRLLDAQGKEVTDSSITRSVNTSKVSITILETKTVPVSLSATGEPAAGYVATGEVSCAPETVTIAGKSSVVKDISEIVIPADELDLTGATADVTRLIDVRNYLPEGTSLTNTNGEEFNGKVAVTVKIEPLVDITREVAASRIQIQNVPEGYTVTLDEGSRVSLRLRGLQVNLDQVNMDNLVGSIDIAAWMQKTDQTELAEGSAEAEVTFTLPPGVTQTAPAKARLNIQKAAEAEGEGGE